MFGEPQRELNVSKHRVCVTTGRENTGACNMEIRGAKPPASARKTEQPLRARSVASVMPAAPAPMTHGSNVRFAGFFCESRSSSTLGFPRLQIASLKNPSIARDNFVARLLFLHFAADQWRGENARSEREDLTPR